jgi:restriction system protein
MTKVWLTRGGAHGQYEDFALDSGTSGGGWDSVEDLTPASDYAGVKEIARRSYVGRSEHAIGTWSGQLWALRVAMQIGDYVLMPR